ncbi:MAG: PAS domain S-box protein [Bacteroidetes bacterium]|nr:PAS domain S-box protein [Bacteroidota bacterium]
MAELRSYNLDKSTSEHAYDFLTRMAATVCGTDTSLLSIIDDDIQWFLSQHGAAYDETPREYAFCAHAINNPNNLLIVEDAREHAQFKEHPAVLGTPDIVFYAAAPLVTEANVALGTLCVVDQQPRTLTQEQKDELRLLAAQAVKLLELEKTTTALKDANRKLKKQEELLRVTQSFNKIGAWEMDLATGKTYWSDEVYEIHEVDKTFDHNKSNGIDFYHPADQERVRRAIEGTLTTGEPFDVTARFITAKGNQRWVRATGYLHAYDASDECLIGSFQDVTSLKESEQKFKGIFDSTFSFLSFLDAEGIVRDANEASLQAAGITQEEVIGKPFWECYWWQASSQEKARLQTSVAKAQTGEEVTYEATVSVKGGRTIPLLFSLRPVAEDGAVQYIVAEGRPIEDVVRARNRYRSVLEGTRAGTWEWNVQTGETVFNERWAEIVGYTLEEIGPTTIDTWMQFAHPDDLKKSNKQLEALFRGERDFYDIECRMRHKNGDWVWVHDRGKVVSWTTDGEPLMMYGTHQDITEQKLIEEARAALVERFEHLDAQVPGALYQFQLMPDGRTRLPYASTGIQQLYGVTPEQVADDATVVFERIHPEDLEGLQASIEASARTLTTWRHTSRVNLPDGRTIWVEGEAAPEKLEDGSILWHGYIQDVTEQQEANRKLLYNERLLQSLYELSPIGIALNDYETGAFVDVNEKLLEPTGYTKEEFLSLSYWDVTPEEYKQEEMEALQSLEATGAYGPLEKEYIKKDGRRYPVLLRGITVQDLDGRKLIWSFIQDISDIKQAERDLTEALTNLQSILDASTQVSIISIDGTGRIRTFNQGAERMLGYASEEVIGRSYEDTLHVPEEVTSQAAAFSETYQEDAEGYQALCLEADRRGQYTDEWTYTRKDGSRIPVLLSITPMSPVHDGGGHLAVAADVSSLKKAEKEIQTLLTITESQNERLKNFAHIVTHNLRSNTAGILGSLDLMEVTNEKLFENDFVQMLKRSAESLERTIENLTEVVRQSFVNENSTCPVRLQDSVDTALHTLMHHAGKADVELISEVQEGVCVEGVPAYVDSVVSNFISNGIKYSDPAKESFVRVYTDSREDEVVIAFEDNGIGIDLGTHGDDLFGMYNTFHDNEDARGVGLYITKNQIASMGGRVEVESKPGRGSLFRVYLPAASVAT